MKLRELEFTDLYIASTGEYWIRGEGGAVLPLPDAAIEDGAHLLSSLTSRRKEREFACAHDGVAYRVSCIDAQSGTWWAVRRAAIPIPRFNQLGFDPRLQNLMMEIGKARGLVIIVGAMGAGKTTTASALMVEWLSKYGDVGVTIEDPPELPLEGPHGPSGRCFQIATHEDEYDRTLKYSLRYRPRFIMVGEIRSPKVASQALRAAVSGHIVVTTIHGGSVVEGLLAIVTLARQVHGDLAREILADGLAGVIYQRLLGDGMNKRLHTRFLTAGTGLGDVVRAKIRAEKYEQLESEVQMQANRLYGSMPDRLFIGGG